MMIHEPSDGKAPFALSLFGTFELKTTERDVKLRMSKSRALLAYLALAKGRTLFRNSLAELLWSGYDPKSARTSLRQVIAEIRGYLSTDLFLTNYHTLQLRVDPALLYCDVLRFEELLAACEAHAHVSLERCPLCQRSLRDAISLYRDGFLKDFPGVDSEPFVTWLQNQRQHYAERFAFCTAALHNFVEVQARPPGNLPMPTTPLLGRTSELLELKQKLHHPGYRCLTLVGLGGIGKTRLALALGAQEAPAFPDGVWFVDLSVLAPAQSSSPHPDGTTDEIEIAQTQLYDRIAVAMLSACRLALQGAIRPTAQLLTYLQEKTLLFILDNFEHLSAGAGFFAHLLANAPTVRLLVTSRQRLDLQGQQLYRVTGLPFPAAATLVALQPAELVAQYTSLQLFLERAALTECDLTLDAPTLATMVEICQLVDGLPLALELAAALLEEHTLPAITQMIRANYQILQSRFQDLPPRQRSAQAVLQTTWQLLTPEEAQILASCALFHGGFTLDAAETIAGASSADLKSLLDKSLLQQRDREEASDVGRYDIHELVRQFALEQLTQDAFLTQKSQDRHATYYLSLVASWQPTEAAERAFRAAMLSELENVERAWAWALLGEQISLLLPAVEGIVEFYEMIGAFHAADVLLQNSITQVRTRLAALQSELLATSADDLAFERTLQTLLAALLMQQGYVYSVGLAQLQQAHPLAEEALALAQTLNNIKLMVRSYHVLAAICYAEGEFVQGQELGEKALRLVQQSGLRREEAMCLSATSMNATAHQDFATALRYFPQALALAEADKDTRKALLYRNQLGVLYRDMGDLSQALHCFEQNLPATREFNDVYNIALATVNLGFLRLLLGDYPSALEKIEEGYQRFQELGEKRLLVDSLALLGYTWLQIGNFAAAEANCLRALAQPQIAITAQQIVLLTLCDLHRIQGDLASAQSDYTQLITLSQRADVIGIYLFAKIGLATLLLDQNKPAAALEALEELLPVFAQEYFDIFWSAPRFLLCAYQILAANHDSRAAAILHQAWQIVMRDAEKISNPDLRNSYLTNVQAHHQLAQLIKMHRTEPYVLKT